MPAVEHYRANQVTEEIATAIATLTQTVWPSEGAVIRDRAIGLLAELKTAPQTDVFVIWDGCNAAAHAATNPRRITFENGSEQTIMALKAVCVDPARRGEGLGADVVRAAFGLVDGGKYPLSLFQTSVPDFYRRLGAETVDNQFLNGAANDAAKSPWWDPHIMIYPATAPWPSGKVDLNGPGY